MADGEIVVSLTTASTPAELYAFDDDRLSRNEQTQFEIKTALTKNTVTLYTNKSTTDFENPTDRLIKSVFDAFAS